MTCEPRSPSAPAPDSPRRARHRGRGPGWRRSPAASSPGSGERRRARRSRRSSAAQLDRRPHPVVEADLGHPVGGLARRLRHRPGRRPAAGRAASRRPRACRGRARRRRPRRGRRWGRRCRRGRCRRPGDRRASRLGAAPPPPCRGRARRRGPASTSAAATSCDVARRVGIGAGHRAVCRAVGAGDVARADDADPDLVDRCHRVSHVPMRSITATLRAGRRAACRCRARGPARSWRSRRSRRRRARRDRRPGRRAPSPIGQKTSASIACPERRAPRRRRGRGRRAGCP